MQNKFRVFRVKGEKQAATPYLTCAVAPPSLALRPLRPAAGDAALPPPALNVST